MLKIGHRGACGYQPENTLLSFQTALSLGAEAIEFDVRRSKDGELVVFHDATLNRTTNGQGLVCEKTLGELRTLDAGKEERIPTLAEICDLFGKRTILNIELKEAGIADPVLRIVKKFHLLDSVIISAFPRDENGAGDSSNWLDLFWIKAREKQLKIALLAEKKDWAHAAILAAQAPLLFPIHSINVSSKVIDESLAKEVREKTQCKLMVWTVNEPEEIAKMKMLGVDGIFSDYPDRL